MRIFHSRDSAPMLLDSVEGLNSLKKQLDAFVRGNESSLGISADTWGSPKPYEKFLEYIEFVQSAGAVEVKLIKDSGLRVSGSNQNLQIYIGAFQFDESEDCTHRTPSLLWINNDSQFPKGLDLIVEADNYYINEHQHQTAR